MQRFVQLFALCLHVMEPLALVCAVMPLVVAVHLQQKTLQKRGLFQVAVVGQGNAREQLVKFAGEGAGGHADLLAAGVMHRGAQVAATGGAGFQDKPAERFPEPGGHVFQRVGDILLRIVHALHAKGVIHLHYLNGRARDRQANGHFRTGIAKTQKRTELVNQDGVVLVVAVVANLLAEQAGTDAHHRFLPVMLWQGEAHLFQQIR